MCVSYLLFYTYYFVWATCTDQVFDPDDHEQDFLFAVFHYDFLDCLLK